MLSKRGSKWNKANLIAKVTNTIASALANSFWSRRKTSGTAYTNHHFYFLEIWVWYRWKNSFHYSLMIPINKRIELNEWTGIHITRTYKYCPYFKVIITNLMWLKKILGERRTTSRGKNVWTHLFEQCALQLIKIAIYDHLKILKHT